MTKYRDVNKCRRQEKYKMAALIRQAGTKWPINQRFKKKKKKKKKRMVKKKGGGGGGGERERENNNTF